MILPRTQGSAGRTLGEYSLRLCVLIFVPSFIALSIHHCPVSWPDNFRIVKRSVWRRIIRLARRARAGSAGRALKSAD